MESVYRQYYDEPRYRPNVITAQRLAGNVLGRKTGEGFYRYDGKGKAAGPAGRFAGTIRLGPSAPQPLDGDTIAERVILAIVNEAYRALGDRVATADDIDRAMRLGANHPFGPFEWARRTGLQEVALMLDALADEDADKFRPSLPLLREAR
jgi:3-hydroxybutyryl-CoA dehydrogenase